MGSGEAQPDQWALEERVCGHCFLDLRVSFLAFYYFQLQDSSSVLCLTFTGIWEHLEASVKSDPNTSPSVAEKHGEGGQGTPGQSLVPCFLSFSEDRQLKLSGKSLLTNIPVLTVLLLGSMGLLTSVTEA